MNLPFSLLAERIGIVETSADINTNKGVYAAERWAESGSYRDDTVYILTRTEWKSLSPEQRPLMALAAESEDDCGQADLEDLVCRRIGPEELLSLVNAEIRDHQIWNERLLDMLLQERDISDVLMMVHQYIHNPSWIIDENNCLLGYTKQDQPQGQTWQDTLRTGYIAITGSTLAEFSRTDELLRQSRGYIKFKISSLPFNSHAFPIRVKEKNLAYMIVVDTNVQMTRGKIALCQQVVDLLTIEMRKRALMQDRQNLGNEQFLLDLLNKRIPNDYIAEERLQTLFWEPQKYYAILVIPGKAMEIPPEALSRISRQVAMILPRGITLVYEDNIACLLTFSNKDLILSSSMRSLLSAFLSSYRVCCGISEAYDSLCLTAKEFSYALHTVRHYWNEKSADGILFYNDFKFSRIRNLLAEKTDIESLCYPGLLKLMEYDKKKGTEFTHTLSVYLRHNMSPNQTAEELFIHRSTLNYRLKKIEEIGDLDLKNSDLVFLINLSLRLLSYEEDEELKYRQ